MQKHEINTRYYNISYDSIDKNSTPSNDQWSDDCTSKKLTPSGIDLMSTLS